MNRCTYLLPIRRNTFWRAEVFAFASYFKALESAGCEVIVIDGSEAEVFEQHQIAWASLCRHVAVDRSFGYLNDKVNGVHTGVRLASTEAIVLADDDIRYTAADIEETCRLLKESEVVRPQNFLSPPHPWWARMESARMLINRATLRTGDYPGTCAFRRSAMLSAGHYDGDVLFDNEEIIRHFASRSVTINYATGFFINKRPSTYQKWLEQRPRQAYEDFGLRAKTTLFASLLPLALLAGILGGATVLMAYLFIMALVSTLLALAGRRRDGASSYFPLAVCLFAPLWVIERGLSTYWAFYWYLRYGGYPFGERLLKKGIGRDWFAGAAPAPDHPKK